MAYTYSAACGPTWMPARDMLSPDRERSEHQVYAFLNRRCRAEDCADYILAKKR